MKQFFKKLTVLVAVLCLALGFSALTACGEKDDDKLTYTVHVTCADAAALAGVKVQFRTLPGNERKGEVALTDGTAVCELQSATYSVVLTGLPDGFDYPETTLTPSYREATVNVAAAEGPVEKVTYTVKVQLPDGTPVPNIIVQLCNTPTGGEGQTCNPASTNAQGVATLELDPAVYEVHITEGYPAGYTFDSTKYTTTETGGELVVTLDRIS